MNVENYITVFTPTYNRGYIIEKLYTSLKNQKYQNFEWLIIDDGSTDKTQQTINTFIEENAISIRYIRKENEGKHIAINLASEISKGEWVFIVDSDDYLTDDALSKVNYYINSIKDELSFAGVVGLRGDNNKNAWITSNPDKNKKSEIFNYDYIDATTIEYRYKYKIKGDRAEVIRRDVLKQYKFPKFKDEKFLAENYLWINLALDGYSFRWFNHIIYITDYLEDGLTRNGRKIAMTNPLGKSFSENVELQVRSIPMRKKLKHSINYYRYGKYGGKHYSELFKETANKWVSIITLPLSVILKIRKEKD